MTGDNEHIDKARQRIPFVADAIGTNRSQKRRIKADLERELTRDTMADMANEYRAKRRAKRREAAKVKNKNRRRK